MLRHLLREPYPHFPKIGPGIYILYNGLGEPISNSANRIVVIDEAFGRSGQTAPVQK